uniref:Indole-3-acetic acid-induced protein ARG7 n=1 Tax=Anthurium amnicola TaxID=1678845 RepID=A0A1D1ZLC9_9ARAE
MEKPNKRGLILKTWQRCRSIGRGQRPPPMARTKSWPGPSEKGRVAPEGCLCVRVGAGKERFLIKMEYVNHPVFKTLLEEAEMEYGYANEGPLELPCDVDLFQSLLFEIEQDEAARPGCNFARGHGAYQLLSPARTPMVCRPAQRC